MKIGISGFGFVGSAVYESIKDKNSVEIYDPNIEKFNDKEKLLECGVIFICAGTPLKNNEMDASAVNDNLIFLHDTKYEGLVVLKSTIHPKYLLKEPIKTLNIVSNPEFLNEHTALDDFKNQDLIIVGGRIDLCNTLKNIYESEFNIFTEFEFMSFEEALIFKYIRNIKIAYDVMYWEFVQETTGNYRKYKHTLSKIPFSIDKIRTDTKPGIGGHCLPKDTKSYPEHELTEYISSFNNRIRNKG
jgi:UDP-glucose 6-dehydrogenase